MVILKMSGWMKVIWVMHRSWLHSIGSSLVGPKEPEGGVVLCHDYNIVIFCIILYCCKILNCILIGLAVACNVFVLLVALL